MPDIDISDRTPKIITPREFDRMLPEGGIEIHEGVDPEEKGRRYIDACDVSKIVRSALDGMVRTDPDESMRRACHIQLGKEKGRRFRVYIFKGTNPVEIVNFTEFLNGPFGYGREDFNFGNYVFPEHSNSKLIRYAHSALIHFVFMSGLMRRIYLFIKIKDKDKNLFEKIESTSCSGKRLQNDNPEVLKYMSVEQTIETDQGTFGILEMNAEIYNSMDLKAMILAQPGRKEEDADAWLAAADAAVEKIRKVGGRAWKP